MAVGWPGPDAKNKRCNTKLANHRPAWNVNHSEPTFPIWISAHDHRELLDDVITVVEDQNLFPDPGTMVWGVATRYLRVGPVRSRPGASLTGLWGRDDSTAARRCQHAEVCGWGRGRGSRTGRPRGVAGRGWALGASDCTDDPVTCVLRLACRTQPAGPATAHQRANSSKPAPGH